MENTVIISLKRHKELEKIERKAKGKKSIVTYGGYMTNSLIIYTENELIKKVCDMLDLCYKQVIDLTSLLEDKNKELRDLKTKKGVFKW